MMGNQTTANILSFINGAEKTHKIRVQELYQKVNTKPGDIKFSAFWSQRLGDGFESFDKVES